MDNRVFFAYSSHNQSLVEPVIAKFQGAAAASVVEVVDAIEPLDADILPEVNFRSIIRDLVQSANRVVVFWSKEAATSQHVQYELGMADALDKPLIIVQLDQTTPELPAHLLENVVHLESLSVGQPPENSRSLKVKHFRH
jgi:hypothetical protein